MIPGLTADGVLPPGLHETTIDEIRGRFGRQNAVRRRIMKGLEALAERALAAGALELHVNGSFVTGEKDPGDWDGILIVPPAGFSTGSISTRVFTDLPSLRATYHADLFMLFEDDNEAIDHYLKDVSAHDREGRPKAMLNVRLKGGAHGTDQE